MQSITPKRRGSAPRAANSVADTAPADSTILSAAQAASFIAERRVTASTLAEALLARCRSREPAVQAWAYLDENRIRAAAGRCDQETSRGVLHGVPIGIKDVIDTADQPTEYNSEIYRGHKPAADAVSVARLKSAGAIIFGKTVTTEFAYLRPGPTRNPHAPDATPGGSSSGSAAAVADRMVPAALGTQTGGSTIRPAAYCGVYGYKPAFDLWDTRGTKYLAPSLDTIGLFARSLDDIALISSVLAGAPASTVRDTDAPRFSMVRPPNFDEAEPAAAVALEKAARVAASKGAAVRTLDLPASFQRLNDAHRTIMSAEVARAFATEWRDRRDGLSPEIADFIVKGMRQTEPAIAEAWRSVTAVRRWLAAAVAQNELLLTLSAPGEAPASLASTGSAIFNRLWTLLHAACLHVPTGRGPRGLPIGVQLVSLAGDEALLLAAARWLEMHLGTGPIPVTS